MQLLKCFSNGTWDIVEADEEFFYIQEILKRESWLAVRLGRAQLKTKEDVLDYLKTGKSLNWDDEWYAKIKMDVSEQLPQEEMVKCDCGHTVEKCSVMSTSSGSSCPDCYDRMSM